MPRAGQQTTLMYHGIVGKNPLTPRDREEGAGLYDVAVDDFREQLLFLKNHHYPIKPLEQFNHISNSKPGFKTIVLTFDDGEMNNFREALPILQEFQFPAYFFVTVNKIGNPGYMGWEELKELISLGMVVGSHSLTHPILTGLEDEKLGQELKESKRILEEKLGIKIENFSVPHGFYDEGVVKMALEVGYRHIFVSEINPRLKNCIGRMAVKSHWSLRRFKMGLEGKVPLTEEFLSLGQIVCRCALGDSGYDRFRKMILRLNR